jgi:hypothetical protein
VKTSRYGLHYSGRFLLDEMRIAAGNATGVDILNFSD